MTTNDYDLARLWQTQKVATIDTAQIEKDFHRQTLKQRLYLFLDFACLVPFTIFVFLRWDELSTASAILIIALLVVTFPIFIYMARLRWLAAAGFHKGTANYLDMLISQMRNNAKIAWITKHSSWSTALILAGFYGVMFYLGELSEERQSKALIAITVTSIIMFFFYRWARKRESRFRKKVDDLLALKHERIHDNENAHR